MSLSDKIIEKYIAHPCLTTKDVKEFIEKIKKRMRKAGYKETADDIDKIINEEAGPKLVEKK